MMDDFSFWLGDYGQDDEAIRWAEEMADEVKASPSKYLSDAAEQAFWRRVNNDSQRINVTYSNFDCLEGLPDDELIAPERGGPDYSPLPEERPSDYGPIEFDIADLDDE